MADAGSLGGSWVESWGLIAASEPMRRLIPIIADAADCDAPVVIEGEPGTGKQWLAQIIHSQSARSAGPFVTVHCSGLSDEMLTRELFGGGQAVSPDFAGERRGCLETASGGTVFLDEIGDLSAALQTGLLAALERRIPASSQTGPRHAMGVRIIAATSRPLAELVASGSFRQDLYYRLRVVSIAVPALRDRADDIPLLAQHFVDQLRGQTGRPIDGLGEAATAVFARHVWPGNVRELENAIACAFVKARAGLIEPSHLPPEVCGTPPEVAPIEPSPPGPITAAGERPATWRIPAAEMENTRQVLAAVDWNLAKAARRLGVSRTTLYKRIGQLGLKRPRE